MDEIRKIPLVTRTLVLGTLGVTLAAKLMLVSPYLFLLHWPAVTGRLQVWRILTTFLFNPAPGLGFLFDIYLLYRHSNELEKGTFYEKTADYTWTLTLVAALSMALSYPLKLSVLSRSLLLAIVHYWGQANATQRVSLYGFFTIPARFLSFALLGLDVLTAGPPAAMPGFVGVVAGHALHYLREIYPRQNGGRTLPGLATPSLLTRYLSNGPGQPATATGAQPSRGTGVRLGGGTAFPAARPSSGTRPGGSSTTTTARPAPAAAPAPPTGHRWGSGNRLGTD